MPDFARYEGLERQLPSRMIEHMFASVDITPFGRDPTLPDDPPSRLDHDLSHQPPGPMLALMRWWPS